jgi:hypothetical protein
MKAMTSCYRMFAPDSILSLVGVIGFSQCHEERVLALRALTSRVQELSSYFGNRPIPLIGEALIRDLKLRDDLVHFTKPMQISFFQSILFDPSGVGFDDAVNILQGYSSGHRSRDNFFNELRALLSSADTLVLNRLQRMQYPTDEDDTEPEIPVILL